MMLNSLSAAGALICRSISDMEHVRFIFGLNLIICEVRGVTAAPAQVSAREQQ